MWMVVWLVSAAEAGDPDPFTLPPGERRADWEEPLALAGFELAESSTGVVVRPVANGWHVEVRSSNGNVLRAVDVAPPSTEAGREDVAWLARSLLDPVVGSGMGPELPASAVSPRPAEVSSGVAAPPVSPDVVPPKSPARKMPPTARVETAPPPLPTVVRETPAPRAPPEPIIVASPDVPAPKPEPVVEPPPAPVVALVVEPAKETAEQPPKLEDPPGVARPAKVRPVGPARDRAKAPGPDPNVATVPSAHHRDVSPWASLGGSAAYRPGSPLGPRISLAAGMQIDDARLGVGLRLGPSDRLTDVAEEARSRDAVLTGTAAWTPGFLRYAAVGGVALRTFTESGTTVARGPVPLVGAEAAWERRLSPRFTLGVFARVERDLRAVDLTLDGTSTDAWTPTSVYAGVEVLVL